MGTSVCLAHEFPLLGVPVPAGARIVINTARCVDPNLKALRRLSDTGSSRNRAILGPDRGNKQNQGDKKYWYEFDRAGDDTRALSAPRHGGI